MCIRDRAQAELGADDALLIGERRRGGSRQRGAAARALERRERGNGRNGGKIGFQRLRVLASQRGGPADKPTAQAPVGYGGFDAPGHAIPLRDAERHRKLIAQGCVCLLYTSSAWLAAVILPLNAIAFLLRRTARTGRQDAIPASPKRVMSTRRPRGEASARSNSR